MKAFEINVGNPSFSLQACYCAFSYAAFSSFLRNDFPSSLSALTFTLPQTHICPLPVVSDLLKGHALLGAFPNQPVTLRYYSHTVDPNHVDFQ